MCGVFNETFSVSDCVGRMTYDGMEKIWKEEVMA
jgi:hypothetical protein